MFRDLPKHQSRLLTEMPWCPSVPSHWTLSRNKNVMARKSELVGPQSEGFQLLSLTKTGIIPRDISTGKGKIPATFDTYQVIEDGDIVMCLFDVDETPRTVGRARQRGMITGAYDRFVIGDALLAEYLCWFYIAVDNAKALRPLYRGLRKTVPVDQFMASQVPIPPQAEQVAIVKYLAHAHARIDTAVSAKRRLILLIQHQLRLLEDQDLNQPSNSSLRLKTVLMEVDARSTSGAEQHLSMSQQLGLVPADQVARTITAESMAGGRLCNKGDIVLNRLKAHLGVFAVAPMDGVVSADYTVLRAISDRASPDFLCAKLASLTLRPELRRRTKGIVEGFWRLYTPDLLAMKLDLPDIETQVALMATVVGRRSETAETVRKIRQEIALLEEFRERLIAEVVTGCVDVRAIAASIPDAPEAGREAPRAFEDELATELGITSK